ncbi:AMP-dependent synthetase [[Pantoea] beijingensis]|uniref:AMP-dependent synthetase n=1 Tax=[Pantoea] beijingensis TaxID=1324864 RepID=A0A443IC41_9GAMM|nr:MULTISPECIES: acyl-CoA synthetase [Erwiniaceae]RWR01603.1 AMP-dependent synthetase [[Pantoea] beijingensis]
MNPIFPLSQWLSPSRPEDTLIAWLGDRQWTLGQLRHDVAQLVDQLQQQDGERWALCFENGYLFLVALLATLSAGKTPVIPGHCRAALLQEQQALFCGVISDSALMWPGVLLVVESSGKSTVAETKLPLIAETGCIELFTSGSTGTPKRVIKSVASLDREALLLASCFSEQLKGCRVVASVVPQHLYGLTFRIFLSMSLGLPMQAGMLYYAEQFATLDPRYRYAFISSPAFLKRLDPQLTPPPVEILFSAGGMLPWHDVLQTQSWLGLWPNEIYGSTETGVLGWRLRQQDDIGWQAFTGVKFIAEGEAFRAISPLIDDERGVLLDDVLHLDGVEQFRLGERRGRVVKIEEKRISLSEIERRLIALEGIREAVALPVSRGGRQGIGAVLVLEGETRHTWQQQGGKVLELAWRRALLPWLEPVALPRYWRIIDEIPVNSMNKRIYAQLQELFNETP